MNHVSSAAIPKQSGGVLSAKTYSYTVWVPFVLLAAALLRLFMLTTQSMWYDEGVSLVVTDSKNLSDTYQALWSRAGGDKYQPFYFMLLASWRAVFGDSEFALRVLSVFPGVAALGFIYAATSKLFNARHAFWTTIYLACSAFWISYSQEVRPYAWLFLLGSIQLYCFCPALSGYLQSGRRVQASKLPMAAKLVFAAITLVSCMGSILLVVFTAGLAITHLLTTRNIRSWFSWWWPVALACAPAIIYFLATPAIGNLTGDSTNGIGMPLYKNAIFSLYGILAGHTYGPPLQLMREGTGVGGVVRAYTVELLLLALVIGTLLVSFTVTLPRLVRENMAPRRATEFLLVLFLVLFCLAVVVAKVTAINWMPRHSFYLSIPIAMLLPLAFCRQFDLQERRMAKANPLPGVVAYSAFVALVCLNLYASYNYYFKSQYARDDYRSAAAFLASHQGEADRSILLWGEMRLLSYYGANITKNGWDNSHASPLTKKVAEVDDETGGHIFLAINREFTWSRGAPYQEPVESQLADRYQLLSVQKYVNFNIYEFEHKATVVVD